jgi:hypothetical protein
MRFAARELRTRSPGWSWCPRRAIPGTRSGSEVRRDSIGAARTRRAGMLNPYAKDDHRHLTDRF